MENTKAKVKRDTEGTVSKSVRLDFRTPDCLYIEIGEWTYYIDDSTNEQIIEKWATRNEYPELRKSRK